MLRPMKHTSMKHHIENWYNVFINRATTTCYNIEVNAKFATPLLKKYFVTQFEITIKAIYLSARIQ
jgi:hypothetical protein